MHEILGNMFCNNFDQMFIYVRQNYSLIDVDNIVPKNNDMTNSFQTLHREKSRIIQYV